MAKIALPEISLIRNRVEYCPATGILTWKPRTAADFTDSGQISALTRSRQWNNRFSGRPAFSTKAATGYLVGPLGKGLVLFAHRVAFALMEDRWPTTVDHINGDKTDNRWENLREVSPTENAMNCRVRSDSVTGRTGVRLNRRKGWGYYSVIKHDGSDIHLGTFDTFEEACAARTAAEKLLGYSARHGKSR